MRQIEAGGSAARLVPTLVVNVCIFTLLLIEVTLIVSRSRPVAKAPGVKPRLSALVGTWLIYLVVLLPVRVDLPAPMYYVSAVLADAGRPGIHIRGDAPRPLVQPHGRGAPADRRWAV